MRCLTCLAMVAFLLGGNVAAQPPADWPKKLHFGVVPTEGGADTTKRFTPLAEQLTRELGVPVEVVSASSYQGVVTAMANKQIEFAWLGPKSYVEAAKRADAEALVIELSREGERGYRAIFIVPAASKIRTLEDARGKRFAYTDPNSASGRLIPAMLLFEKTKMSAERFFGEVKYSGSHGTSILQVANGELDVAATNDLDFRRMVHKGAVRESDVRVILQSELIPGAPVAGRRDLPASLKKAFADALIKASKDKALLEKLQNGGFAPATDEEYDIIRATDEFMERQEKSGGK